MIDKDIILTRHRETPAIKNEAIALGVSVSSFLFFDGGKAPVTKTVSEVQAMLSFAPINSPAFTGNPTAPTQTPDNNSTRLATTEFVGVAIGFLNSDLLVEIVGKAPLASPVLTGTPTVPTASAGTNTTQAASTAYVMAALATSIAGLDIKASVRVASNITPSVGVTPYENGDVLDGVTLVTGDRILLKQESTAADNGIYTVNASGNPTRASDFDSWNEIPGAMVSVEEGTIGHDKIYICTSNAGGIIGSTSITFVDPFQLPGSLTSLVTACAADTGTPAWNGTNWFFNDPDLSFAAYDYAFVNIDSGDDGTARYGDARHPWGSVQSAYDAGMRNFYLQSIGSSGDLTLDNGEDVYLDGVIGSLINTLDMNTHNITVLGSGYTKAGIQVVYGFRGESLTAKNIKINQVIGSGSTETGVGKNGGNGITGLSLDFENVRTIGNIDIHGGPGGGGTAGDPGFDDGMGTPANGEDGGTGGNGGTGGPVNFKNVRMEPGSSLNRDPGAGGTGGNGGAGVNGGSDGTHGSDGDTSVYQPCNGNFNELSSVSEVVDNYTMIATCRDGVFYATP